MTVLEDDVIPVRSKLSLSKHLDGNRKKQSGSQLKRKAEEIRYPAKKASPESTSMLNGYRSSEHRCASDPVAEYPVATLSNTGNTCYLNSVLYTLRFAPTFLHNLHHLVDDLHKLNARLAQNKAKSSSLGRNVGTISGPSSRSTSSKDLLSLTSMSDVKISKSKVQIVTEKLHELFMNLHGLEEAHKKYSNDTFQPTAFLQAVREANYIFEGNQQQDAHELLVYLLDNIRETCDLLAAQVQNCPDLVGSCDVSTTSNNSKWNVRRSWKKMGKKKQKTPISEEESNEACTDTEDVILDNGDNGKRKFCYNFVAEDFEGVTLRRTTCLECESVTERKEPFYDIPVPITDNNSDMDPSELYMRACVTTEKLCDSNKYLCERCIRYNEASREVSFEKLPNIMVLQLKRFTTTTAGVQKVNTYMPTPLRLACFCETCCHSKDAALHRYELCCVIMHLGGAMASGHYIAYVRASDQMEDYADCTRDLPKGSLSASSSEKSLNLFKFLKQPKSLTSNSVIEHKNGMASKNLGPVHVCKSRSCCGVKMNKYVVENAVNFTRRNGVDSWHSPAHDVREDMWLECDDESVRPITSQELQDLLSNKPGSTSTPYLLFYSKITEGTLNDD